MPSEPMSGHRSINARHLRLISVYSLEHAVRGGAGLVYLILALSFGLTVANAIISPVEVSITNREQMGAQVDTEEVVGQLVEFARPAVVWSVREPDTDDETEQRLRDARAEAWADYLLDERPALLSAIFAILVFGMPFVIPLGAFDQTSGDIGNRGLRYLLLRTERQNIYLGRALGTAVFAVLVQAFMILVIAIYLGAKVKIYPLGDLVTWSLYGFLALTVLSLPYVAFSAWISASTSSGMVSLVVNNLVVGGVLLAAYIGGTYHEGIRYVEWVLPWGIQRELLAPSVARVATAVAMCLGYTVVFLFLGHRTICTRDL